MPASVDLSDLRSVAALGEQYAQSGRPLHVLINNAGVMASPLEFTRDGLEMQFGVNHIGTFR
jgi:NAD(P)-dependent dehydrogenase (short-subunit alcohol dehydrogenase family)